MSDLYAHDTPGPHLILDGRLQADTSRPFVPEPEVAAEGQVPTDEPGWVVPLSIWKTSRATLRRHKHPVAVLLEPDADLHDLLDADGTLNPAGIASTKSPWLAQTRLSLGSPARRAPPRITVRVAFPYSRRSLGSTFPPSSLARSCMP